MCIRDRVHGIVLWPGFLFSLLLLVSSTGVETKSFESTSSNNLMVERLSFDKVVEVVVVDRTELGVDVGNACAAAV